MVRSSETSEKKKVDGYFSCGLCVVGCALRRRASHVGSLRRAGVCTLSFSPALPAVQRGCRRGGFQLRAARRVSELHPPPPDKAGGSLTCPRPQDPGQPPAPPRPPSRRAAGDPTGDGSEEARRCPLSSSKPFQFAASAGDDWTQMQRAKAEHGSVMSARTCTMRPRLHKSPQRVLPAVPLS